MPFAEVQSALEAWRQAVKEAEGTVPGSEEYALALANVESCRAEYQMVFARAVEVVDGFEAETDRGFGITRS